MRGQYGNIEMMKKSPFRTRNPCRVSSVGRPAESARLKFLRSPVRSWGSVGSFCIFSHDGEKNTFLDCVIFDGIACFSASPFRGIDRLREEILSLTEDVLFSAMLSSRLFQSLMELTSLNTTDVICCNPFLTFAQDSTSLKLSSP